MISPSSLWRRFVQDFEGNLSRAFFYRRNGQANVMRQVLDACCDAGSAADCSSVDAIAEGANVSARRARVVLSELEGRRLLLRSTMLGREGDAFVVPGLLPFMDLYDAPATGNFQGFARKLVAWGGHLCCSFCLKPVERGEDALVRYLAFEEDADGRSYPPSTCHDGDLLKLWHESKALADGLMAEPPPTAAAIATAIRITLSGERSFG